MRIVLVWFFLVVMLSGFNMKLRGQSPDTVQLKSIQVTGSRASVFTVGNLVTEFDSSIRSNSIHRNIGELMATSSAAFIKTYGSGGSATISSRGTEARHTAVLWNGFNINSASLGLTDLSLVPVTTSGKIRFIHGGSVPVNGNSAIGGVISLEQEEPLFHPLSQMQATFEAGSFGNLHFNLGANLSTENTVSRSMIFSGKATNDFEYVNMAHRDKPVEKLEHGSYKNYGIFQDLHFKIKTNHLLSAGLWYEVNRREIPPMMTVPQSTAEQRDSLLRAFLSYRITNGKSVFKLSAGHFREHQFYTDPEHLLDLSYFVINYLSEFEWRYYVSEKLVLSNGITYTNSSGDFEEYSGKKQRYQAAVYSNTFYEPFKGWKFNAGIRKEITSGANPPLSPSVGMEGNLYKNIILISANTGLHYNLPGMNDLYWVPGGNPDLLPEKSWSSEAGLTFFKSKPEMPKVDFTVFKSVVDNWIKWQPVSGGIYSPDNLREVTCSGMESSVSYLRKISIISVSAVLNYAYTRSVLTESYDAYSEDLIGKQLIYIPEHVVNAIIQFNYRNFSLSYNHTYTGERYITADNSQYLEGYHLADIAISNSFHYKKTVFNVFAKVMNVYDGTYQVLAYRPTPGRWYSFGIKMNLNLK